MNDRDYLLIVHWTDYVANEWTEIVQCSNAADRERLDELAEKGRDNFGMTIMDVGISDVRPTLTSDEFFALDWGEWVGVKAEL